jgi:hypothetical protein
MSRYRVVEGAPSVSLDKKLYAPGDLLPETINDEAIEQLLKNGAIEKTSAKDESKAEQKAAEDSEEQKAKADADAKAAAEAKAKAEAVKTTTGTNKPPAK